MSELLQYVRTNWETTTISIYDLQMTTRRDGGSIDASVCPVSKRERPETSALASRVHAGPSWLIAVGCLSPGNLRKNYVADLSAPGQVCMERGSSSTSQNPLASKPGGKTEARGKTAD